MKKVLTIGEILLRLTPNSKIRLSESSLFHANYGGAEANVAISLSQLGYETVFLSALPNNDIGNAAMKHLRKFGVDTSFVARMGEKMGLYFYEEGYSYRNAKVIYDRMNSSITSLNEDMIPWEQVLEGVDLLHITGITPALGEGLKNLTMSALKQAKKRNILVSFDFNYRNKLWGYTEAKETYLKILPLVDICFAGYKDFIYLLAYEGDQAFNEQNLLTFYQDMAKQYSISYLACTNREVFSSTANRLTGYLFHHEKLIKSDTYTFEMLERIGAGDAFAAGALHGILADFDSTKALNFAIGASVLKHSVYGDCNQFTEAEILEFMNSSSSEIMR